MDSTLPPHPLQTTLLYKNPPTGPSSLHPPALHPCNVPPPPLQPTRWTPWYLLAIATDQIPILWCPLLPPPRSSTPSATSRSDHARSAGPHASASRAVPSRFPPQGPYSPTLNCAPPSTPARCTSRRPRPPRGSTPGCFPLRFLRHGASARSIRQHPAQRLLGATRSLPRTILTRVGQSMSLRGSFQDDTARQWAGNQAILRVESYQSWRVGARGRLTKPQKCGDASM